jgi:putative spermidine/putrescine transport system ATP-binding protein
MRRIPKPDIASRVRRVLDMVQLAAQADRYPRQLSGGQQQRVALGRALVIEPRILLLDEPLANLDAKLREGMRLFIRELQQRVGITTVYVTHDQSEAMTMSDRVVVMLGGRIAQAAPPADIYERPATLDVARFVGQANLIPGIVALEASALVAQTAIGPIPLSPGHNEGAKITLLLRPEAISLLPPDKAPITGRIAARVYTGSAIDYRIALPDGTHLHAQVAPTARFVEGDTVGIAVQPDRLWPLPDAA